MWKRCIWFALLMALLGGTAYGAFDPLKDAALAGWWSFSEGKGTTVADSSSYHRSGTLQGGATWVPGRFGSGIQLDGTSGYISIPTFPLTTDKITMAAWIKGWKAADWAAIITGQPARLELCFGDNTTLHYAWNGDSSATWSWAGGPVIPQDTWAMVALTIDPTQAVAYVYTDQGGLIQGTNAIAHISQTFSQLELGFSFSPRYFRGIMDEACVYSRALTRDEILVLAKGPTNPALAVAPSPEDGAMDVPRDTSIRWTAGTYAVTHDVYLGKTLADVNSASLTKPAGVLASQGQTATSYTPAALPDFGQTYYWRIDEVNKASDNTTFKGNVWSFTVEPYAYPITGVIATASSSAASMGPEKTIDGSGLTGDLHGTEGTTMWLTGGAKPNWIQYQFDKVYKLYDLKVWNSNQMIESFLGFGAKKVTIETSADGTTWTALANVPEFARATGLPGYAANTTVNLGGVMAKYVKLTINSNWGGMAPQTGLSEVRFSYIPVQARLPQPATMVAGIAVDPTLNWRPGREAGSHQVFFGTDPNAVANGTASAKSVTDHAFTPGTLNLGTTYYWKVDEVNTVTYPGDVWSFTTQEYAVVDDFESYNDDDNRIYDAWIDGYTDGKSGSIVGNMTAPFAEQTIVHGGEQAMPFEYNNVKSPYYSEASRTFDTAQNWTTNGADTLSLYFRGRAVGFTDDGNGTFSMSSSGTDVWNNGDQFRFAYKSLNGDGSIVARVDSIVNTNVWAKGGVMIRQSIDTGSTHAFMPITAGGSGAGNGASFQRRLTAAGASTNDDNAGAVVAAPYWVKVERKGNSFTGSISPDGKTWTPLGTAQTITMTNPVLIGLALCSHDAALTTVAEFSNVSTTGTVTGSWQDVAIGAAMPTNGPAPLYLTVQDKAGKTKTVVNPNPSASATAAWTQWRIPLSDLTGVSLTAVQKITLGVGDKTSPKAGPAGMLYFDDIGYGKPATK
ncbi:MAG: discoidin domain-containing protein [Phycisphaerae bacterium]|nr:discoidin domain-containing protein [Phycisphaerae bacterium]